MALRPGARTALFLVALAPALVAALGPAPALASDEPRLDHRGQLSVFAGPSFEELVQATAAERVPPSAGGLLRLALGVPLTDDGGEGLFGLDAGRGFRGDERLAVFALYRGYAGDEAWKTFFDAGAFVRVWPAVAPGARLGFGVQHDFTEHLGVLAGAGFGAAFGAGVQASVDVSVAVQWRFGDAG